jgi:lysophospholipase L1-like esterase
MKAMIPVLSLCAALAGCATTPQQLIAAVPPGSAYAAMGSSYAAGAGIGPLQPGSAERCNRNTNNYASLLAARLKLRLTDASCSGATTAHVLDRWDELPPQIEAVTADTRLVTITVGGNDLNFMGWLFSGSCRAGVSLFPGPCREASEPSDAAYAALESRLLTIAQEVRRRAPNARLVFVQYVRLISPQPCGREPLSPGDAAVASRIAARLAEVTRNAARNGGAVVLAADTASQDHTPCSVAPWANGLTADHDRSLGAPWHPNAAGHAAIAALLVDLVRKQPD